MDRQETYPNELITDVKLLSMQKNAMLGLAHLARAVLGSATVVAGLPCAPTSPASMSVTVDTGSIYALAATDATAYASLGTDATQIVKQGINPVLQTLACPAPSSAGQSIVYLISAAYQDSDTNNAVLKYYNSASPTMPFTGPANNGAAQPTVRQGLCAIAITAGVAAATGSAVSPAAPTGYTGLYTVTVSYGATTVTAGNIVPLPGSPTIPYTLPQIGLAQSIRHGQCRFQYVSPTAVALLPCNGNGIQIAGTLYQIPAAGVSATVTSTFVGGVAGQVLTAGGVYWVYAFMNGNVMALDFYSPSPHAPDTTAGNVGVEVRSGDSTRTLVGLVYIANVSSAPNFVDSATTRGVRSWFNRQPKSMSNTYTTGGANQTTSGGTYAEYGGGACRLVFVSWADDVVEAYASGSMATNVSGAQVQAAIQLDTNPDGPPTGTGNTAATPIAAVGINNVSEGYHYLSLVFSATTSNNGFITNGSGLYGRI